MVKMLLFPSGLRAESGARDGHAVRAAGEQREAHLRHQVRGRDDHHVVLRARVRGVEPGRLQAWLPDGYSQIFRSYVFGPSGFRTMAPLRYAAKFDA